MRKFLALAVVVVVACAWFAASASAHVHGITPLLTLARVCGVTDLSNTGANRAQGDPIHGVIPIDVGNAPLTPREDGGFLAPVGCATHGP